MKQHRNNNGPRRKTQGAPNRPNKKNQSKPRPVTNEPIRLNRYIAQAGICARRKADEMIKDGLVKVNDVVVTQMGIKVSPGDVVEVNGNRISPLDCDYILLNKPRDVITTNKDEAERENTRRIVLDLIEDPELKKKGLFPVGRLDRNTTGVLLLTNDGELAHRLMHPSFEVQKLYWVKTKESVTANQLAELQEGIEIEGELYKMDEVAYANPPRHDELGVSLHEGKNRHIRKMIEAIGHNVQRLERVRYAGMTTTSLRPGRWRRLTNLEIKKLRRIVKLK